MKEKVWEKRYRAERQKVIGAAQTLAQLERVISAQKVMIELLMKGKENASTETFASERQENGGSNNEVGHQGTSLGGKSGGQEVVQASAAPAAFSGENT